MTMILSVTYETCSFIKTRELGVVPAAAIIGSVRQTGKQSVTLKGDWYEKYLENKNASK